jgi:hypothetical protein
LEAQKHPEAAPDLIRMLADRLAFLDKQNEEQRGEIIMLKRRLRGSESGTDVEALQRRIQTLEEALRRGSHERYALVYASDRIELNQPLNAAQPLRRTLPDDVRLTLCAPAASLLIVTTESRVFNITLDDLPAPQDGSGPAALGNPRDIAAILDQAVFERCRFLTLLSQSGYVYSLLAGTINTIASRQEKLIRNLIPGDPLIAAIPSYNGDLFAISRRGRWTRFSERTIAGSGSLVMDLPKGDTLAGIISLAGNADLIFITEDGHVFARASAELAPRKVPGASSGMLFKGQTLLGVTTSREFTLLTRQGCLLTIALDKRLGTARTEAGLALRELPAGDSVLTFATLS